MTSASAARRTPWAEDDRRFFAAHPKRHWRMRVPQPGEIAAAVAEVECGECQFAAGTRVVIVHQIEPGTRLRILARSHRVNRPIVSPMPG